MLSQLIKEWVKSPFYLGSECETLYPYWADVIVDFCEGNFNELIFTGSIRSGKSNTALLLTIRKLYELTCFSPIPNLFNLSATSLVLFMYLSLSLTQANLLGLGRLRRMIDRVPYFNKHFPRDRGTDTIVKFSDPTLMVIGGSSLGHFKGSDLYLLIFDEANFTKGAEEMKLQNAIDIYRESSIRRKSTFLVDGVENGLGIIVSSADTQSSFVEKHIKEIKNDPGVMIVHSIAYEVQPSRYAGMGTFWVFVGDELIDPFIPEIDMDSTRNFCTTYSLDLENFKVESLEPDVRTKFRAVPVTFLGAFKKDIFGSLKEVCGVAVGQEGRFFTNRIRFNSCFPKGSSSGHPFTKEEIVISYLDLDRLEYYFKNDINYDPNMEYFGGIDQSVTDDSTGLALGHIDPKSDKFHLYYDILLRIPPPKKPAKISPEKITEFFEWLKVNKGVKSLKVTQDWYAATQSIQKFHLSGIDAELFSVDKNWDPYRSFAGSILDGSVSGYLYKPFKEEWFDLIQNNETKKVNHPSGGQKDVSDAATHVHNSALQSFLEIKSGIKFFDQFGAQNIKPTKWDESCNLVAGIYFGPGPFYICWLYVKWPEEDKPIVFVIDEYVDFTGTIQTRTEDVKRRTIVYSKDCKFAGDPEGRIKGDMKFSPLMSYRKAGMKIRCRKNIDRMHFEIIKTLVKDKDDPRLLINEYSVPLMTTALRKARYKMRRGMRSGSLEVNDEMYPLFALRFALEEAISKSKASGY